MARYSSGKAAGNAASDWARRVDRERPGSAAQQRPSQKTYVDFQPSEQQQETQANRRHHLQRSVHVQPAEYLWPQDDAEKNFEHDRRHGEPEHPHAERRKQGDD